MSRQFVRYRLVAVLFIAGACLLPASGCGTATYRTRLEETRKYFEYLGRLNDNLRGKWREKGIELRVPKEFVEIPPPEPPAEGEAETTAQETFDPRQPDYIRLELPGLVGAWKADDIPAAGDGDDATCDAYLYVLSNYDLWLEAGQTERPRAFHSEFVSLLVGALGVPAPAEEDWQPIRAPERDGYVEPREFLMEVFTPPEPIDGRTTDFFVFLHEAGDMQTVILFVIPRDVDSRLKLTAVRGKGENAGVEPGERMLLCLETLKVSSKRPRPEDAEEGGGTGRGVDF